MPSTTSPTDEDREDILFSCRYGDFEDVQAFLSKFSADAMASVRDENENCVLHMVCANGHDGELGLKNLLTKLYILYSVDSLLLDGFELSDFRFIFTVIVGESSSDLFQPFPSLRYSQLPPSTNPFFPLVTQEQRRVYAPALGSSESSPIDMPDPRQFQTGSVFPTQERRCGRCAEGGLSS